MKHTITVMLLVLLSAQLVCAASMAAKYVNRYDRNDYITLESNRTFALKEKGLNLHGKYSIDGDTLTLTFDDGETATGTIKENTLIDNEGQVWVKE
jgi:Lipocalin-like domain